MKKIILTSGAHKVRLSIPENPSEVKLSQYIDFSIANAKMTDWMQETELSPASDEWKLQHIRHLLSIVSEFTRTDITKTDIPIGDFEKHLLFLAGEPEGSLDLDNWEQSLTALYASIFKAITAYTPKIRKGKDCLFSYKSKTFSIPSVFRDALTGQKIFPETPTGLVIEALEIKRVWQQNMENDKDGSLQYTALLKLVALLSRREDEEEPMPFESRVSLSRWIESRIHFFQDIDMQTALDIHKWLTEYYNYLEKNPVLHYFFNPPKPIITNKDESEMYSKAKIENENRWKRAGFRFILHRIEKSGAFTGLGKTPFESARLAPFEDALGVLSDENAIN